MYTIDHDFITINEYQNRSYRKYIILKMTNKKYIYIYIYIRLAILGVLLIDY